MLRKVAERQPPDDAAVLVGAVLLWRSAFVKVEREIDLPPIGEAAYNPLYALKKSLADDGAQDEASAKTAPSSKSRPASSKRGATPKRKSA